MALKAGRIRKVENEETEIKSKGGGKGSKKKITISH